MEAHGGHIPTVTLKLVFDRVRIRKAETGQQALKRCVCAQCFDQVPGAFARPQALCFLRYGVTPVLVLDGATSQAKAGRLGQR